MARAWEHGTGAQKKTLKLGLSMESEVVGLAMENEAFRWSVPGSTERVRRKPISLEPQCGAYDTSYDQVAGGKGGGGGRGRGGRGRGRGRGGRGVRGRGRVGGNP